MAGQGNVIPICLRCGSLHMPFSHDWSDWLHIVASPVLQHNQLLCCLMRCMAARSGRRSILFTCRSHPACTLLVHIAGGVQLCVPHNMVKHKAAQAPLQCHWVWQACAHITSVVDSKLLLQTLSSYIAMVLGFDAIGCELLEIAMGTTAVCQWCRS
jgi:hypothetical protein